MRAANCVLLCLLGLVLLSFVPQGVGAVTITVNIDGTILTGEDVVILSNSDGTAKQYAGYTIAKKPGSSFPARVRAVESDPDILVLEDAVITATAANVSGLITFSGEFTAPPSTDSSVSPPKTVSFSLNADGTMRRGTQAAKDDVFSASAFVQDPPITGPFDQVGDTKTKVVVRSIPASYGDFSLATSELYGTGFQGNRVMKGQASFFLQQINDKLTITSFLVVGVTTV